jgi:hypothetical protein
MARHATIAAAQTEAAIVAIGAGNTACEGRIYPASDADVLYVGMSDGSVLGPLPGSSGGGSVTYNSITLDASGETSMTVRYLGTDPTLTKDAAGEYTLALAADTQGVSFVWNEAGGTLTGANSLKLKVTDASGAYRYVTLDVYDTTGNRYTDLQSITQKATQPTAGEALHELSNMSNVPGDWRIVGIIS